MQLLRNAKENLLQTSVAILAIGAGVYLPTLDAIRNNPQVMLFLSLFAAFGGALLSKALEGTSAIEERVLKRFRDQLRPINRHLASITKEITSVTRGSDANQITSTETVKLIDQLVPNLIGAMTDIGDVVGEPFDPNTIYQTAHQVEELDKLLSSLSRYSKDTKQKALIIAAKTTLAEIHPDVYKRVSERINCPHCGSENEILIGEQPPASAVPTCATCKQSFHAHRGKDLKVFTSIPGSKQARPNGLRDLTIKCSCGEVFRGRANPFKSTRKICFGCGQVFMVNSDGTSRAMSEKRIHHSQYASELVRSDELFCTEHHCWIAQRFNRGGLRSGYCDVGSHIVAIDNCPANASGSETASPQHALSQ